MSAEKPPPWAKLIEEINALPTADPNGLFDTLGPSLHAALPGLAEDFKRAQGRVAGFVVYMAPNLTFGLQSPEEVAAHLRGLAGALRLAEDRAARLFEDTAARLLSPPPALEQFVPSW